MEQDYSQPGMQTPHQLNPSDPLNQYQPDEALWKITGVTDMPGFDPKSGTPMNIKRIDFQLHDGDMAYIELPARDFDPDKVGDTVHREAVKILSVKALQGPPKSAFYGYSPTQIP